MQLLQPDWTTGVDFCHHILPSTDDAKVTYFPQSVVVYAVAFLKICAGPTSMKRIACWS